MKKGETRKGGEAIEPGKTEDDEMKKTNESFSSKGGELPLALQNQR